MANAARRFQNIAAFEAKSSLAFIWQSAKTFASSLTKPILRSVDRYSKPQKKPTKFYRHIAETGQDARPSGRRLVLFSARRLGGLPDWGKHGCAPFSLLGKPPAKK
jgi:hypothetical protein